MYKKQLLFMTLVCTALLAGCGTAGDADVSTEVPKSENSVKNESSSAQEQSESQLAQINMTKWQYEEEKDVYWQVGIAYCQNPADEAYETLGIYVPGAYMTGTENGDGTYTCEVNTSGTVEGYTVETAPIVIPVDTPGYSAMAAPTGYVSSSSTYTDAGFVYVYAGCRGRDAGAPAGVTDLKAAIRYIRYNEENIPGSTDRIFSFGMSGGGAQSALLGSTGDSDLYTPYLEAIGAVSGVSDAVAGSMCWCPITNLDYASEAYEWNLGVTRTDLTEDMQKLSDAMAERFALYINQLELKDEEENTLKLESSEDGIYQAGSYYDYLKTVIESSLNNFLKDTTFPYTVENGKPGRMGGFGERTDDFPGNADTKLDGRGGREMPENGDMNGELPKRDGELLEGELPKRGGELPEGDEGNGVQDYYALDGIERNEISGGITISGTYENVQDYIDALNAETTWVTYDSETNTAAITSIADFVSALKIATKDLGAFDALDKSQGENILFGDGDGSGDHFDAVMTELLADTDYGTEFTEDLARTDALGNSVEYRVNMYNPLYYLCDYYKGYKTSNVATYWRIRTGINQSDTALTTEVNLALALKNCGADVDFETVWGQAHVEAERTGDSTTNFVEWVNECLKQ